MGATPQRVVAAFGEDSITSRATDDTVSPFSSEHRVFASATVNMVTEPRPTDQIVAAKRSNPSLAFREDDVASISSHDSPAILLDRYPSPLAEQIAGVPALSR